jgi:hypothetical protein
MIPVYGFLEGDTLGLLLFAYEDETVGSLINKLQISAKFRVPPKKKPVLFFDGKALDQDLLIGATPITALDRIDVVETAE